MSLCWHCCHPYDNISVHMPFEYNRKLDLFSTQGDFCSWMCTKAYAKECHPIHFGRISENITTMRRKMEEKTVNTKCAPHKSVLKSFGGTIDIDEFRSNSKNEIHVQLPNEKLFKPVITKVANDVQKCNESTKPQLRLCRQIKETTKTITKTPQTVLAFRKKVVYNPISPR